MLLLRRIQDCDFLKLCSCITRKPFWTGMPDRARTKHYLPVVINEFQRNFEDSDGDMGYSNRFKIRQFNFARDMGRANSTHRTHKRLNACMQCKRQTFVSDVRRQDACSSTKPFQHKLAYTLTFVSIAFLVEKIRFEMPRKTRLYLSL